MADTYPTAQNPEDPSSYFLKPEDDIQKEVQKQKLNQFLGILKYYAIKIWPYLQKIIETVVYAAINLIKSIVKIAMDQIKNFKG